MSNETIRLKNLLGTLMNTTEPKQDYIGGLLGTYVNGTQTIKVPDMPGYVYVRLNGNLSEVISAINGVVPEIFDWKVLVTVHPSNPGVYVIWSTDYNQYGNNVGFTNGNAGGTANLPAHGETHSFGSGQDPVFIYKRQIMQPLAAHPNNPANQYLYVEPDFYFWKNQVKYFPGSNTSDLTAAMPTTNNKARYLTVYLNGDTNTIAYVTGTDFTLVSFPNIAATGTIYNINTVIPSNGIPLAAVILVSGTTQITWSITKDLRSFLDGGSYYPIAHALDPTAGFHTGSLGGQWVIINDAGHFYTGTISVDQALQEIAVRVGTLTGAYYVLGTGSTGILAEWADQTHIRASTIQKTGAGTITISAASNYNLTLAGNLVIDSAIEIDAGSPTNGQVLTYNSSLSKFTSQDSAGGSSSAGGGHDHGVTRINTISGTINIPLLDFAQTIELVSFGGFVIDPTTYSISSGSDYLVFDTALNTNGIVTVSYQILSI